MQKADAQDLPILCVGVVPSNAPAIDVFLQCRWAFAPMGMGGARIVGFTAEEIRAALEIEGIPHPAWGDTAHRVRIMERAAMAIHDERREKAEAKAEQEQRLKSSFKPGKSGRR